MHSKESSADCPFCAGRSQPETPPCPDLEPTTLERETPHAPDCPLLSKRPIRGWAKALLFAAASTVALPAGCDSGREFVTSGLDDGTISALDASPDTGLEKERVRVG